MSLLAKARKYERGFPWFIFDALRRAIQELGADYIFAILNGYTNADDPQWNLYFPGHKIAMPQPIADGAVEYKDGTPATLVNYAKDVTAFLYWAAEPTLAERKKIGLRVMIFLIVFAASSTSPRNRSGRRFTEACGVRGSPGGGRASSGGFPIGVALSRRAKSRVAPSAAGGTCVDPAPAVGNIARGTRSRSGWPKRLSESSAARASTSSPALKHVREERVATPWGEPSDAAAVRPDRPTEAVFLARHGRGHRFSPSGDQLPRQHRRAETRGRHRHHLALRLRLVPARTSIPACSCWSTSSSIAPSRARRASSATAASRMFRWPIPSRRCCDSGSRRGRRRGHRLPFRRNLSCALKGRSSPRSPNR